MRRSLLPLSLLLASPLLAACVEDPAGSGCVWSKPSDRLVFYDPDVDPFGDYCYDLRFNTATTAPVTSPTTTTPSATTTTLAATTTTISDGGFTVAVACVPGTPPRLSFSGVGAAGSQVTFANASPYVWIYSLPGPTTIGDSGAWSRDITFEPGSSSLFPFTVTVTNSVAGAQTVTVPTGC